MLARHVVVKDVAVEVVLGNSVRATCSGKPSLVKMDVDEYIVLSPVKTT